jgi:hypothetical protein
MSEKIEEKPAINRDANSLMIDKLREKAENGDVTYDLNRWFGGRMVKNDPELLAIQKQGFISDAVKWLKSTLPEGMKYGKASKEERIAKAREFAEKAKTTIEELAKQLDKL